MNSKSLRSALLTVALCAAGFAAAQVRVPAVYTGNEREVYSPDARPVEAWIEARKLGRHYAERGLHSKLLEFDAGGERYWAWVGFPASQRIGSLKAGERVELLLEQVAGQQLAVLLGQDSARPIRASPSDYRGGRLRFEFAGRKYEPALMEPALNPSALISYPDAGLAELSLVYGDITNVNARLRFTGLTRAGDYADFRDFHVTLTLQGTTYVRMTPAALSDCRLVIARMDAGGADGTFTCRRTAAASELMPTALEFSAKP